MRSQEGDDMFLSQEDYESFLETLDLLSEPGLLRSIKKARKDITEGRTFSMNEVFGG